MTFLLLRNYGEMMARFFTLSGREALKILMLSPVYFRLDLWARKDLLNDFLHRHGKEPRAMTSHQDDIYCSK